MAGYLVDFENLLFRMAIINKWAQLLKLLKKEIHLYDFSPCSSAFSRTPSKAI